MSDLQKTSYTKLAQRSVEDIDTYFAQTKNITQLIPIAERIKLVECMTRDFAAMVQAKALGEIAESILYLSDVIRTRK